MVAKLLLARGANPNLESGYLVSAFMAAYCMGHTEIADLLKAAGADPYPHPAVFCNIWCASELESLVQKAIVGSSNSDVSILGAAAIQYSKMGQTSISEEMGLLAVEKTERILGDDNPDLIIRLQNLAQQSVIHQKHEKAPAIAICEKAEKWARRAIDRSISGLGPQHPETLSTFNTLIEILEEHGKSEEAKKFRRNLERTSEWNSRIRRSSRSV